MDLISRGDEDMQTLKSMFPEIESEVIEIILLSNESKMDGTIDTLLGMS